MLQNTVAGNCWGIMTKEEHDFLCKAELEVSGRFDKSVLALSGGALALSLTFVKDFATKPICTPLLGLAWICFAISIGFIMWSMITSQESLRKQREINVNLALASLQAAAGQAGTQSKIDTKNKSAENTNCANYISVASLILGILFLGVFSIINLDNHSNAGDKDVKQSGQTS